MRKTCTCLAIFLAVFQFVFLTISGSAPAAQPGAQRLALIGGYPDSHPVVSELIVPWTEKIAEKSDYKLIITYYGPDIIVPTETHFEAMRRGIAPLAQQSAHSARAALPLSSFFSIPTGLSSSLVGTDAMWRTYKNSPDLRREYEPYKLISLHSSTPTQLHLNFHVKDADDLKEKRILCSDKYTAAVIKSFGAEPFILPQREYLNALKSRQADGVALPFDLLSSFGLESYAFSQSLCLNINVTPCWILMSMSSWNALPREMQRLFDAEIGEGLSMQIAGALDAAAASGKARLAGKGVHIKELGRDENRLLRTLGAQAARELWIEDMRTAKYQSTERFLERALSFIQESESAFGR